LAQAGPRKAGWMVKTYREGGLETLAKKAISRNPAVGDQSRRKSDPTFFRFLKK
jgi:hypothetical protein